MKIDKKIDVLIKLFLLITAIFVAVKMSYIDLNLDCDIKILHHGSEKDGDESPPDEEREEDDDADKDHEQEDHGEGEDDGHE